MEQIAFLQRVLPLYRTGFYKALSQISSPYHFTLFCPKGKDTATNIKTISPEQLRSSTNGVISWVDTKIIFYKKPNILWQSGIIMPVICKKFKVLMINNQMTHLFYWLVVLLCKIRGIKIVFWSHGLQGNETDFKLWLKKWYLSLADINLVYSAYNKNLMIKAGMKAEVIKIVYNSLDIEEQEKYYSEIIKKDRLLIKKDYIKNDQITILFVGRLVNSKKVDMLLKAVKILKSRGMQMNIIIVGEGPEMENLKSLTKTLELNDWVQYIGRVYEESELVKYFYISDIFVSPGEVGLNCIHSLTYGVPVITHDDFRYQGPEVEIIQNNETGVFFRKDNISDLADKMEYWIQNHSKEEVTAKAQNRIRTLYSPVVQAHLVIEGISLLNKL